MNSGSSPSRNRAVKQPEDECHATVIEGLLSTSENPGAVNHATYSILFGLYRRALEARSIIERTVSLIPHLEAQCEEYLTQEMHYVSDAYSSAITNENPAGAQKQIEEAIARIEVFYKDLVNRWPALRSGRRRAISEPSHLPVFFVAPNSAGRVGESSTMAARRKQEQQQNTSPRFQSGPRRPVIFVAASSSTQSGECSAMVAHLEQEQQQGRLSAVQPEEPENNPAEHGMIHPEEPAAFTSTPPVRRATFGDTTVLAHPSTSSGFRRPLAFRSVVGALRRSLGETRLEKVKELWRRARDHLKKKDSSS
ncbi:hypothetical protein L873DRAFT_1795691 [Choiromyces venosus 120613-1]|uniref:Uncharacterized protein n=1 Tax=Choiromyces venosus 120613-1 TaxID=1336337 RepID=A0A3N4IW47_9PEZI|nr:hypothetical protein L873DRAFT_1795691 [Choiromyces venosus 120613-1]